MLGSLSCDLILIEEEHVESYVILQGFCNSRQHSIIKMILSQIHCLKYSKVLLGMLNKRRFNLPLVLSILGFPQLERQWSLLIVCCFWCWGSQVSRTSSDGRVTHRWPLIRQFCCSQRWKSSALCSVLGLLLGSRQHHSLESFLQWRNLHPLVIK